MPDRTGSKKVKPHELLAYRLREKKSILITLAVSLLGTGAIYVSSRGSSVSGFTAPVFLVLSVVIILQAFR
ncbi:MAG TPA: hypothetical protein VF762_11030, partial [Blastocatellia bacterium]